jgi:hypothetical protein
MLMIEHAHAHAHAYEQKKRAEKNRPGGPKGGVAQKGVIHVSGKYVNSGHLLIPTLGTFLHSRPVLLAP